MIDSKDIKDLHPTLQRGYNELVKRMAEKGFDKVGCSSTYRDNEKQNQLYAKGRTTSGSKVTNAKGGESIHNYKLAFDIFQNKSGHLYDNDFINMAGKIWTEMGGEWGGSWKDFVDKPHFQFTNGLKVSDLQKGKKMSNDIMMKWEIDMYKMTKANISSGDKKATLDAINYESQNYIKVRDLEKLGFKVGYDNKTGLITIDK